MAHTKLGDTPVQTSGDIPSVGTPAPDFLLTDINLKDVSLRDYKGKNVVLNIFPSVDTSVCAASVREFNTRAAGKSNTVVLCIAKDLPFAMKRFCAAEGISNVEMLSDFRNKGFSKAYGVELMDGPFAGLHARVVVVIDERSTVKYSEIVPSIGQEPNYEAALKAI